MEEKSFDTLQLIKGYLVIPVIFLLYFNSPIVTGNTVLSDRQVCFDVYAFINNHPSGYNVLDVQSLDNTLNTSTEPYLDDFYGNCIKTGYITSLQMNPPQEIQGCATNVSSFFNASIPLPLDIYIGDLSCSSEKNLNYVFALDSGTAKGIRFWIIIPFILLIVLGIYAVKRKKKSSMKNF